jgi:hypothetical protein
VRKKYPGELGKARKPAKEWDNREALHQVIGKELSTEERDREAHVDLIGNRDYYDRGIKLIAEYYGIVTRPPGSVIFSSVLPPDGAFWRELALKLLRDNVDYFAIKRRGRRATLRSLLPLIDAIIEGNLNGADGAAAKELLAALRLNPAELPSQNGAKLEKLADALRKDPDTVRRERARWKRNRAGGNSD